jgi:hypothetical protein
MKPDAQSASLRHATHADVLPRSLHFGRVAEHDVQLAPQLASVLQTEQVPPLHSWLLPQGVSVGA